jgi:uncharacterized protein (TIGR00251 family)
MYYTIDHDTVTLRVKAQPAASKSEFAGIYDHKAIKIRIKAPAVEGAANKELVKFLSKQFKIPKSAVIFKSGQNSKIKIVSFPLSDQFTQWTESNPDGKSL